MRELSPEREAWNTIEASLSPEVCAKFASTFPSVQVPTEAQGQALTRRMFQEHEEAVAGLGLKGRRAVEFYQRDGYNSMNSLSRNPAVDWDTLDTFASREEVKTHNHILGNVLRRQEGRGPRILYRHQKVPMGWSAEDYAKRYFPVGEVVRDQGFLSTSEDPGYVAGYLHRHESKGSHLVFQLQASGGNSM